MKITKDGNMWHIAQDDFINLMESESVFISEKKCIETGGHCFVSTGITLASNPPQYPEVCKHCGKKRTAVPQEPYRYY